MCRIAGFWDFNYKNDYSLEDVSILMRDTLTHGGPDDAGIYLEPSSGLSIFHRRLSIIDLSKSGHQPMEYDNLVISYNGEVYNFKEIRDELEKYGYKFISNSDTEVILKAIHKWGLDAVNKFRGMFAFAIWNKKEKELILCRDRIGVKPLYWYYKDDIFMFASELKAFHKHPKFDKKLNYKALSLYLQYGYITAPYTIFENTFKLEPGYFLIIKANKHINKFSYWNIEEYFVKGEKEKQIWLKKTEEELTQELEDVLTESFKLRLIADVPVGVFLSGGIDSSTVCALLSKDTPNLKTFTIGFYEKSYNEAEYAKNIANYLGLEHTELYCTPKEAFDIIQKLPIIYDEPLADSSVIPTYLLSALTKNKVKVALSADGGDEQFFGYNKYWTYLEYGYPDYSKFLRLSDIKNKKENPQQTLLEFDKSSRIYIFSTDILKNIGLEVSEDMTFKFDKDKINMLDIPNIYMLYDLKTYLPDDILVKVDRATMAVSLENREPFLDNKIIEWSSQLPWEFKYKNNKSKYLLRKILYKYIPKDLIDRPKQGFGAPVETWFRKDLLDLYKQYLDPIKIKKQGIFSEKAISHLLDDYINFGYNPNTLWALFTLELWMETWYNT